MGTEEAHTRPFTLIGSIMQLPDHDNDQAMGDREDFWEYFRHHLDDQTYLGLRDHFDGHVDRSGPDAAWICLTRALIEYTHMQAMGAIGLYTILTNDHMEHPPAPKEK